MVVYAPAKIISAPAQLITAPAQPPATGAVVYTALFRLNPHPSEYAGKVQWIDKKDISADGRKFQGSGKNQKLPQIAGKRGRLHGNRHYERNRGFGDEQRNNHGLPSMLLLPLGAQVRTNFCR